MPKRSREDDEEVEPKAKRQEGSSGRPVEDVAPEVADELEDDDEFGVVDASRLFEVDAGDDTTVVVEDHRDGKMEFMSRIQHPMAGSFISPRNTGKSYWLKAYLRELVRQKRVDFIIVFSKTAHLNNTFDFLDHRFVFRGYSERIMQEVFMMMTEEIQKIKKNALEDPAFDKKAPHLMIILDDVVGATLPIGDDKAKQATGRCSTLSEIYAMGRHFKVSIWVLSQLATVVLNPTVRNNNDILVIGQNNEDAIEPLYKSTWGFDRLKVFRRFVADMTPNHSFVMYDNLDSLKTGVRWLVVRAPEDLEEFAVTFTSKERKIRKRKAEEEKKQQEERARKRLRDQEEAARAMRENLQQDTPMDDEHISALRSWILAPPGLYRGAA